MNKDHPRPHPRDRVILFVVAAAVGHVVDAEDEVDTDTDDTRRLLLLVDDAALSILGARSYRVFDTDKSKIVLVYRRYNSNAIRVAG